MDCSDQFTIQHIEVLLCLQYLYYMRFFSATKRVNFHRVHTCMTGNYLWESHFPPSHSDCRRAGENPTNIDDLSNASSEVSLEVFWGKFCLIPTSAFYLYHERAGRYLDATLLIIRQYWSGKSSNYVDEREKGGLQKGQCWPNFF